MDDPTTKWNISIQEWLKYYVLLRLMDKSKPRHAIQTMPIVMTFLVSAIWHGFYFSFYGYMSGFLLVIISFKMAQKTALAQKVVQ